MSGPQGGGWFNFIRGLESHTDYVTWMLSKMRDLNVGIVDVKEPEVEYAAHCKEADILTSPLRDCISYYNGEERPNPAVSLITVVPQKWHELRAEAQASMAPYVLRAIGKSARRKPGLT